MRNHFMLVAVRFAATTIVFFFGGILAIGEDRYQLKHDWLINGDSFKAEIKLDETSNELELDNGLIRRTIRVSPNAATVAFDNRMTGESLLRGIKPEAMVTIDGNVYPVGGLDGQQNYAFLPDPTVELVANPAAFQFSHLKIGDIQPKLEWKRVRHLPVDAQWPPRGKHVVLTFRGPESSPVADVSIEVHYNLYDGIPLISKWICVKNHSKQSIRLNHFISEQLALVEPESIVDNRPANRARDAVTELVPNVHVETDYAMGGMDSKTANAFAVHWDEDPQFDTQVNFLLKSRCLLRVGLNIGPDQMIAPASRFESFRAYVMPFDSTERERCGLAQRKLYRIVAPWVQENPLMLHSRSADPDLVRQAIDQAADVGFEMVILTFWSGFDMENNAPEYLEQMKSLADYAQEKGVELGGYSLLSSRVIGNGMDNESPADLPEAHNNSPNLVSPWGQEYFAKLRHFFSETGFAVLEHDGPYPGDFDETPRLPLQRGLEDSQYVQWKAATDFYGWLRAHGIYLNQPDWYFLNGGNKTAMGYREVNWSLPRRQQQIHTRQNIYDGTWTKTPSMGWMFVPLSEYHGGGEEATIEPLSENLAHYEAMLASNLLLGVQACYRGPRLYDTPETRTAVKKWVDLYKRHRDILESDLVHLRRADGRNLDFMLHVNPALPTKGFLAVYNPTDEAISERVMIPLYYTGLIESANFRVEEAAPQTVSLDHRQRAEIELNVPAGGITWLTFEETPPK